MLILSVDTSANTLHVALTDNGIVLEDITINTKKSHSVKLLPEIQDVLTKCKRELSEIDAIACVNGPGSYTGLRIGLATCKLLAYTAEKPLITIKTPDFLAMSVTDIPENSLLCACIDARNTQMFFAVYHCSHAGGKSEFERIGEYGADSTVNICKKLRELFAERKPTSVYFTGDGAIVNKELIGEELADIPLSTVDESCIFGRAGAIGELAEKIYLEAPDKSVFKAENAEAFYLRTPNLVIKKTAVV